jgi:peptidoglycan/LPS O-acetylase OafA/YrhL
LTRSWRVDRFLADMSFPLYLAHWPVLFFVHDYLPRPWPEFPGIVPAIASVPAAAALVIFVERPIERWRQARTAASGNSATSWTPLGPLMEGTIGATEQRSAG